MKVEKLHLVAIRPCQLGSRNLHAAHPQKSVDKRPCLKHFSLNTKTQNIAPECQCTIKVTHNDACMPE